MSKTRKLIYQYAILLGIALIPTLQYAYILHSQYIQSVGLSQEASKIFEGITLGVSKKDDIESLIADVIVADVTNCNYSRACYPSKVAAGSCSVAPTVSVYAVRKGMLHVCYDSKGCAVYKCVYW